MTTETWATVSSDAETWVDIQDSANGYVEALYVLPRYVGGTSGVTWAAAADESTTWTPV